MLVGFHATYTASAMFLTGMAANPLIADFALRMAHVELTWMRWAMGAALPGLLSLIFVPYMIYRMYPPEITQHRIGARRWRATSCGGWGGWAGRNAGWW